MEGNNNSCFGAEIIDKLDCNYLNLIAECISETSKRQQEVGSSCSVEVVGENCEVYKYYAETASIVVDRHFTRSLPTGKLTQPNMNMKAPEEKKGASKRKAKRKPTVTSLMPNRAKVTTDARIHPYNFLHPVCTPISHPSNRVKMNVGGYYMTSLPYCVQYPACNIKRENINDLKPPVYAAFCKGNTLFEVYSPSVGRGFNPRYNSLLIEPTVQAFLPPITGLNTTMSEAMADLNTFRQMAVEFNIPS